MIYNTDFKVKYHTIEEELLWKLKNKTQEEIDKNPDPEYEYSSGDIVAICEKLYIDELTNVFYAEDICDDKIDIGIKYVLEKMMLNNDFKQIIDELKTNIKLGDEYRNDFIIILILFEKEFFHIFHKCICQQLTLGTIEQGLLDELRTKCTF